MDLDELLRTITYAVDAEVSASFDGGLPHEAFLNWCVDQLTSLGDVEDVIPCSHEERGRAVHGFAYSDHDARLDLFITSYQRAHSAYTLRKDVYEPLVKRLENFFFRYYGNTTNDLEVSSPAYDLVEHIQKVEISLLRLYILTDGEATITRTEDRVENGLAIQTHIWDCKRFLRHMEATSIDEDLEIVVSDFGFDSVPCSSFVNQIEKEEVKTYLAVLPGEFLADIYHTYTTRLLERNVRSYLTARNKTNQGILKTIEEKPERFIAFNNGVTITANRLELNENDSGIVSFKNLQIVNGGQTTNTIFRAKYLEKIDISKVFVPAKICVLDEERADELAPRIAEFANKQSVVRNTDIASSNRVYQQIETLSRRVYAPVSGGVQVETKWYFERLRNQYANEVLLSPTTQRKRQFEAQYPKNQKFDKTLLSKAWGAWYQEPEDVCQGNEKYHEVFVANIDRDKRKFDANSPEDSFKRLIALVILRKSTYKIIRKEDLGFSFPGIVTDYSIALIAHKSSSRINLGAIWQKQEVSEEFFANVTYIAPLVADKIRTISNDKGWHPSELAKGKKRINNQNLWQMLKQMEVSLPYPDNGSALEPSNPMPQGPDTPPVENPLNQDVERVMEVGAKYLWALATWAKETNNLQTWQRGIVGSVAGRLQRGREPSERQARQIVIVIEDAKEKGFTYSGEN